MFGKKMKKHLRAKQWSTIVDGFWCQKNTGKTKAKKSTPRASAGCTHYSARLVDKRYWTTVPEKLKRSRAGMVVNPLIPESIPSVRLPHMSFSLNNSPHGVSLVFSSVWCDFSRVTKTPMLPRRHSNAPAAHRRATNRFRKIIIVIAAE
jgi:hypothetical protein